MAITMENGDWSAGYGENVALARIFGCHVQQVATTRMKLRRGWRPKGQMLPLQPDGLPARLLSLDAQRPGLSRVEQAHILGTTPGMVRETVYRLRLDGHHVSGPGPRKARR